MGLFTAIATLGLDGIVVRKLVKDESRKDELIGTDFWLNPMDILALNSLGWRYKIELKEGFG